MRMAHAIFMLVLTGNCEALDLKLDGWSVEIDPATLAAVARLEGQPGTFTISTAVEPHQVANLQHDSHRASWTLIDPGMRVEIEAQGSRLVARFRASRDLKFTWPETDDPRFTALVLPEGEGLYLPFADSAWRKRMAGDCKALSGGLSMPFWSFQLGSQPAARTLTFFARTELRAELCFEERAGRLATKLRREFLQRDGEQLHEIEIWFGGSSPIAPALEYRERLRASGNVHTLAQKIQANPEVAKLAGAIHIYVWGDGRKPAFVADLQAAARGARGSATTRTSSAARLRQARSSLRLRRRRDFSSDLTKYSRTRRIPRAAMPCRVGLGRSIPMAASSIAMANNIAVSPIADASSARRRWQARRGHT